MKKITLLLTLLLCVAGTAWAQFTDRWTKNPVGPWVSATSGFVPTDVETLRANYQTSLNDNNRTVSVYYYEQPVKVSAQGDVTVTFDFTVAGNNHAFKSFGVDLLNESNTVVKNHYEIKLANANNDAVYTLSDVAAGTYRLRYFALNEGKDNALTQSTGTITVTNAKKLKVSSLEEFSNSKLYVIKSGRSDATNKHYLLYHDDGANYLSSTYGSGHSMTFSPSTTNFQFAVLEKGGYYFFYNVYADKFIGNITTNDKAIPMVDAITNNVLIRNSQNGIYNFCLSTNNGAGALNAAATYYQHGVVNWEGGKNNFSDPGNVFEIYEVGDMSAELSAALQPKLEAGYITVLKATAQSWVDKFSVRTFGSDIGQYSCSVAEYSTYLSTANTLIASPEATADQLNQVISNLQTAFSATSINQPQVGKLYRFKGVANQKYISSTAVTYTNSNGQPASKSNMSLIAENDYTTVFMYCEGGKLLSFGRGTYVNATHSCDGVGSANGNAFTFSESTARIGKYRLQRNNSPQGEGSWLVDNTWTETTNQGTENAQTTRYYSVDRNTNYDSNICDWTVEEVEWLPININVPYNVGTIYSPVPLRKDEGRLKFYTGKVNGSELVLTQYTGNVIPANVPFVVVGQSTSTNDIVNGCMYFEISSTDGEAPTAGTNDLQGQQESFAKGENSYYTLQPAWDENDANHNSATDVAFRLFNGTNLQGFRAYLPANLVTGSSLSIRFEGEDDITGIDNTLTNANGKQEIFDLTGRRVSRATKGLYIINGQKVLVK